MVVSSLLNHRLTSAFQWHSGYISGTAAISVCVQANVCSVQQIEVVDSNPQTAQNITLVGDETQPGSIRNSSKSGGDL